MTHSKFLHVGETLTERLNDPFPWNLSINDYIEYMIAHLSPTPERTPEFEERIKRIHHKSVEIAIKEKLEPTAPALAEYPDLERLAAGLPPLAE